MSSQKYTIGRELDLKEEEKRSLADPGIKPNFILKMMFIGFDVLYGAKRTLSKILVLEVLARYPYWAWETGSYSILSKLFSSTKKVPEEKVEKYLRHIELGRRNQDIEEFHMFLIADVIHKKGIKLGWFKYFLMPRIIAAGYYILTKTMYYVKPVWSFAMNAAFESHAEHQYMLTAKENPQWDKEPVESAYFKYYPRQRTLNDLLRRIALDERDHMYNSLEECEKLTG